jgi:hypothetical protein
VAVVVAVVDPLALNVSTDSRRWCGDRHGGQSDTAAGQPQIATRLQPNGAGMAGIEDTGRYAASPDSG